MKGSSNILAQVELEDDVPPTSMCALCGRSDCAGCATISVVPPATLPWESDASLKTLWRTADATACSPGPVFGAMDGGRLWRPALFAVFVEALALGSLVPPLLLFSYLMFPAHAFQFLAELSGGLGLWSAAGVSVLALVIVMVVLHILWAFSLEFAMQRVAPGWSWRRAWRFAMYSCGWDLLTSPAGLVLGSLFSGPKHAWQGMGMAVAVPRTAMQEYLGQARHVRDKDRRGVVRRAMWVSGFFVACGAVGLFLGLMAAWS